MLAFGIRNQICIVMAYLVMAYIVMANVVKACILMAYIVIGLRHPQQDLHLQNSFVDSYDQR